MLRESHTRTPHLVFMLVRGHEKKKHYSGVLSIIWTLHVSLEVLIISGNGT